MACITGGGGCVRRSVHRPPPCSLRASLSISRLTVVLPSFADYRVVCGLYHGGRRLCEEVRPPLNKKLFPVHRPGGLKMADWNSFFYIYIYIFFTPPPLYNVVYKNEIRKKKKKSCPSDWPCFCPPGPQETTFYLRVASVHRPPRCSLRASLRISCLTLVLPSFADYRVVCGLYHGGRRLCEEVSTQTTPMFTESFPPYLMFNPCLTQFC